jgi:hypothetical protein
MCRISLLAMIAAITSVASSSDSQAAGSFQTKPAFVHVLTATPTVHSHIPTISVPHFSAGDLVGGCGRGRVRDPQTHACHGPADKQIRPSRYEAL